MIQILDYSIAGWHRCDKSRNRPASFTRQIWNHGFSNGLPTTPDTPEILAEQPPVVVEKFPASGARDITPGETEIRVRFSRPMTDGSRSWSTAWKDSTPGIFGPPHYEADDRTCVAKVKLEPGKSYGWWINSQRFHGFQDTQHHPAIPYLPTFKVADK